MHWWWCAGIKATNKMNQMRDMNQVCYDKVLKQVKSGYQVGPLSRLLASTSFRAALCVPSVWSTLRVMKSC